MAFSFFGLFSQQKSKKEQSMVKNSQYHLFEKEDESFISRRSFLLTLSSLGIYCFLHRLYGKKILPQKFLGVPIKKKSNNKTPEVLSKRSPVKNQKEEKQKEEKNLKKVSLPSSEKKFFIDQRQKKLLDHQGKPFKTSTSFTEYPRGTLDKTPVFYCVNTHTGDRFILQKSMCQHPQAFAQAMECFSHFCRDHRQNLSLPMDGGLLYILGVLGHHFGLGKEMRLISGYRHPKSNALLRRHSKGVAENSFHCKGKALDIKIQHVSNGALSSFLKKIPHHQGGVGLYGAFVHFDTRGHKAFWKGQ